MIDARSRANLEHPFPGVDGEHVLVAGPGPWAGMSGIVQHQVEHGLTGVVCRLRLSPGGESADIPASRLVFLADGERPRDLRGALSRPRGVASPRFVVVPSGWSVFDRVLATGLDEHRGLTYEAAEAVADALNRGDNDVPEAAPAG